MTPFISNLILFSPLLFLSLLGLYLYDRADSLRRGAGLLPPSPELKPSIPHDSTPDIEELNSDDPSFAPYGEDADYESDDGGLDEGGHHPPEAPEPPRFGTDGAEGMLGGGGGGAEALPQGRERKPRVRNVGKKKAASLARRDERRAYFEFLHAQRRQRQEEEERVKDEIEERIFEEKRRRAVVEEEIVARREEERKARLEAEKKEQVRWKADSEKLREMVKVGRVWEVKELAKKVGRDSEWVERVLKQEGLVGLVDEIAGKRLRCLTSRGYYVSIGTSELEGLYSQMESRGRMSWKDIGQALEHELGFK